MAIPNRAEQIRRVAAFLDTDDTSHDKATRVVDGIYDMWTKGPEGGPIPLQVGMAFKIPLVAKVYHVAWIGQRPDRIGDMEDAVWVVTADSLYGTLTALKAPMWQIVSVSKAKAGQPGCNVHGYVPGDLVKMGKYGNPYKVLAVGDKCALLRDRKDGYLHIESSKIMEDSYQREMF